jgi:hypothetical protein
MILVLAALMLVALLGFVALAVDVGVIATTRAQLQTITDAAALAGARQLATDARLSSTYTANNILSNEVPAATAKAIAIGNANYVAGQLAALTSENIVVGYINDNLQSPNLATAIETSSPLTFNSVQVTYSYTVPALFSKAFRSTGSTVTTTSTATVGLYQISGYNSNLGLNGNILPIALDQSTYNAMMNPGTTTDQYTFTASNYIPPTNNGVTSGADGIWESQAYPASTGSPGNFGSLDFGGGNGASTLASEIDGPSPGMTPAEMKALLPLPSMFGTKSGLNASIKDDLTAIIGKPVSLPIWSTTNGMSGNNLQYNIVAFAAVRIVAVNFQGNPKYVIVQPAIVTDPTAIPNTGASSSWTNGGVIYLHLSR